jgi:hypothetical protein
LAQLIVQVLSAPPHMEVIIISWSWIFVFEIGFLELSEIYQLILYMVFWTQVNDVILRPTEQRFWVLTGWPLWDQYFTCPSQMLYHSLASMHSLKLNIPWLRSINERDWAVSCGLQLPTTSKYILWIFWEEEWNGVHTTREYRTLHGQNVCRRIYSSLGYAIVNAAENNASKWKMIVDSRSHSGTLNDRWELACWLNAGTTCRIFSLGFFTFPSFVACSTDPFFRIEHF